VGIEDERRQGKRVFFLIPCGSFAALDRPAVQKVSNAG
jgi:hypothetical protein